MAGRDRCGVKQSRNAVSRRAGSVTVTVPAKRLRIAERLAACLDAISVSGAEAGNGNRSTRRCASRIERGVAESPTTDGRARGRARKPRGLER